jgi:hypothetical protein
MRIRLIRREIRVLRVYALCCTAFAAVALLGAAAAIRTVTFDTITAHRINIVDREGKLAMVLASHDDEALPVIHGYTPRLLGRAQGNHTDNGIVFFNQKGDEQGALVWNSSADRTESGDALSFDTANTDQLMHVEDGDDNGHHYVDVIGWDRSANEEERTVPMLRAYDNATTAAQRAAILQRFRSMPRASTRFYLGYDPNDVAQLVLSDKSGKPRVKIFVTPDGQAKMQFLDANGNVTYEVPH